MKLKIETEGENVIIYRKYEPRLADIGKSSRAFEHIIKFLK